MLQTDYNEKLVANGFKKYNDKELKDKIYKEVVFSDIDNAFQVNTYCTYKNFKFFVQSYQEGKFTLFPLEDAMEYFKDFLHHGYDPVYEVVENEVEEIWEERKLIEGFKFDVEPIVYLKIRNQYDSKNKCF